MKAWLSLTQRYSKIANKPQISRLIKILDQTGFKYLQKLNVIGFHLHTRCQKLGQFNEQTAHSAATCTEQVTLAAVQTAANHLHPAAVHRRGYFFGTVITRLFATAHSQYELFHVRLAHCHRFAVSPSQIAVLECAYLFDYRIQYRTAIITGRGLFSATCYPFIWNPDCHIQKPNLE